MNFSIEDSMLTVSFSAIATVALVLLMLLLGQAIKNCSEFLKKYCIPASVIGGILFALVNLILHQAGVLQIVMNTAYQTDMQNLFFTAVGLIAMLTSFLAIGAWIQSIIKAQVNISLPGYASSALIACIFYQHQ